MSSIYWPGTEIVKSQNNAFTAHLQCKPEATVNSPKSCKCCCAVKPASMFEKHLNTCKACRYERQRELRVGASPKHMGAYSKAVA